MRQNANEMARQYAVMAALAPLEYPAVVGLIAFGLLNPDPTYAPTFQTVPEDRPSVLEQAGEVGLAVAVGAVITKLGVGSEGAATKGQDPFEPEYVGGKTTGVLRTAAGDTALVSGYNGPSKSMPLGTPGMNGNIKSHVESHAASIMRQQKLAESTLFINRVPCAGPRGCGAMLPRMLPEGSRLKVVGPGGYNETFTGLPDK